MLQLNIIDLLSQKVYVVERLVNTPLSIESSETGRIYQIAATWENFLKSPFIGLGYNNAATGVFSGIVRSNFLYTQVLASGGIVLFIIFFTLIFKLFATRFKLLKSDIIVFSVFVYVIVLFFFRRPDMYLGLAAYIVWVRKYQLQKR
jgi:O-antigen ligase